MSFGERWKVKGNGGKGGLVGICSNKSDWFIAEEMHEDHAELICSLFNSYQAESDVEDSVSKTCLK